MIDISLDGELTDKDNVNQAIHDIKSLLPSIQYSINQKIKRFSPFSPNMLLFGKNMNDALSNSIAMEQAMASLKDMKQNTNYKKRFKLIDELNLQLAQMRQQFIKDHKLYVWKMKKHYDQN